MRSIKKLYALQMVFGVLRLAAQFLVCMFGVGCIIFSAGFLDILNDIPYPSMTEFSGILIQVCTLSGVIIGATFLCLDGFNGRLRPWRICVIVVTYIAVYNLAIYGFLNYMLKGIEWLKTGVWLGIVYIALLVICKSIDGIIVARLVENIRYGIHELQKSDKEIIPEQYNVDVISDNILCLSKNRAYFHWHGKEIDMEGLHRAIRFLDGKVSDLNSDKIAHIKDTD